MADSKSQLAGPPRGPQAVPGRQPISGTMPLFQYSRVPSFPSSTVPVFHHSPPALARSRRGDRAKQSQSARAEREKQTQFLGPVVRNKANLPAGLAVNRVAVMQNKANLEEAERMLTTVWQQGYETNGRLDACENKANSRGRDGLPRLRGGRFGVPLARPARDGGAIMRNKANLPAGLAGNRCRACKTKPICPSKATITAFEKRDYRIRRGLRARENKANLPGPGLDRVARSTSFVCAMRGRGACARSSRRPGGPRASQRLGRPDRLRVKGKGAAK